MNALFLALLTCLGAFSLPAAPVRTVVFFGDSITAGYGLEDSETQAYPADIQGKVTAAQLAWKVVNAGLSGETSAGGLRRVDWILKQPIDLFVLALGGNDGLRGTDPSVMEANLQAIVDKVRAKDPKIRIIIAGMQMPTSMGESYTKPFAAVFPDLAAKNHLLLVPFLLDKVGGHSDLNQGDQIHPTAEGARIVANTVWQVLEPVLRQPAGS
jgi:acyl-CoA thioesterase I